MPNFEWLREVALANLPEHFRLIDVRCEPPANHPDLPSDFEIVIEYKDTLDTDGSRLDLEDNAWSDQVFATIREQWTAETIRVRLSKV